MLDWNAIDTVLLDMDGTLLDLHYDNHFWSEHLVRRYAERSGLAEAEARARVREVMASVDGTLDWYCLDYWSATLGLDLLPLKREIEHLIAPHPYSEAFLAAMAGRKRLALVTNAHPETLAIKLRRTGIERYFDEVVSSHRFGQPKEAEGFWHAYQAAAGFEPAGSLLVEDNVAVLETARRFGIGHLVAITRPDSHREPREVAGFPAVADFRALIPE